MIAALTQASALKHVSLSCQALRAGRLWRCQRYRTGAGTAYLSQASLSGPSRGLCSEVTCVRHLTPVHQALISSAAHPMRMHSRYLPAPVGDPCRRLGLRTVLCTSGQHLGFAAGDGLLYYCTISSHRGCMKVLLKLERVHTQFSNCTESIRPCVAHLPETHQVLCLDRLLQIWMST